MAKTDAATAADNASPATTSSSASAQLQDGVRGQVDDRKNTFLTAAGHRRAADRAGHLPARPAQRQEEDDLRRDPEGLTMADRTPLFPSPSMLIFRQERGRRHVRRQPGLEGASPSSSSAAGCCARSWAPSRGPSASSGSGPGETLILRGVTGGRRSAGEGPAAQPAAGDRHRGRPLRRRPARRARPRPRVPPRDLQRHARARRRPPRRRPTRSRSVPSSREAEHADVASAGCAAGRRSSTCPATTPTSAPSTSSSCAGGRSRRRSPTTTCCSRGSGCSSPSAAARTRSPCGTCSSSSATRPTGSTSGSASATTATSAGATPATSPTPAACACARSTCATTTATTCRRRRGRRAACPCSACGLSKRHLFDAAARDGGYDVVATGHNLDDEAAVLLGNTLRWDIDYLARQLPALPGGDGFPRKVKPLVRLTERETAAWCIVRGIDYQVEECPMAAGNKHLGYKATLNQLEARVARHQGVVLPRLRRAHGAAAGRPLAGRRRRASAPAPRAARRRPDEVCAFCRLVEVAGGPRAGPRAVARCRRPAACADAERPVSAGRSQLGERVLLLDAKRRRYLVVLSEGGEFHSHAGFVPHADVIGARRGRRRALDHAARSTPCCGRRWRTSCWRCPAAPRSSTPRTWRRSACSPTSARARGSSRPASARARCR